MNAWYIATNATLFVNDHLKGFLYIEFDFPKMHLIYLPFEINRVGIEFALWGIVILHSSV